MAKKFTVLSLYSGAMRLDIGVHQTGKFRLLGCVEKVPSFCDTIRLNRDAGLLGTMGFKVYQADMSQLDPATVMADLGLAEGDLDLIVGGPPCQSFSTSGKRGTVQDPRGTQLWHFLRFVDVFQPKAFLMENVRGLMSAALNHRPISERPDKGGPPLHDDEQPGSVIRAFIRDLHDEYRVDCFEVNAVNYGAPQLRERAIFIGNRFNRVVEFPSPTHGIASPAERTLFSDLDDEAGLPKQPFRTLGDALNGLLENDPVIMDFSPRKKGFLAMIPPGGNWRCLPEKCARDRWGKHSTQKEAARDGGDASAWTCRARRSSPCPTMRVPPYAIQRKRER